MPFSDTQKLEVKRKAHFCCAICHSAGVEIHHIIPQSEGGSDEAENSAPLCPSCHEIYGANPTKRKFIREARDHWYELCAKRYAPQEGESLNRLIAIVEQSRHDIVDLRNEILTGLEKQNPTKEIFNLGLSGVLQYLLSKYTNESFPKYTILFSPLLWKDDDLPEIKQKLFEQLGAFLVEKITIHVMHETNINLRQPFTEDEFGQVLESLITYSVLLEMLRLGELAAHIDASGIISWQQIKAI